MPRMASEVGWPERGGGGLRNALDRRPNPGHPHGRHTH